MKIRVKFNHHGGATFGKFVLYYFKNFSVMRSDILNSYNYHRHDIHRGDIFDIEYLGETGTNDYIFHFVGNEDSGWLKSKMKPSIELISLEE